MTDVANVRKVDDGVISILVCYRQSVSEFMLLLIMYVCIVVIPFIVTSASPSS